MTLYKLKCSFAEESGIKGLILKPGVFTPHIDGKPTRVHFSKEVILKAFDALKPRLDRGAPIMVRLSHPGLNDISLKFGLMQGVGVDREKGEVWLTGTKLFPEVETLLSMEARSALFDLGLSVDAELGFKRMGNGDLEATSLHIEGVSIVDRGAFEGSRITKHIPLNLAARMANLPINGVSGGRGTAEIRGERVPAIQTQEDIPAEVREELTPEQQKVYMDSYNEAIDSGKSPVEAHSFALSKAHGTGKAEAKAANGGTDMTNEEKEDMKAKDAELGELKAKAAKADELANEVKTLKAKLAAKETEGDDLATEVASMKAKVAKLEAESASLAAQKAEVEAKADVEWAVTHGYAKPAARAHMMKARAALGSEEFKAMLKAQGAVTPVGEMGFTGAGALPTPEDAETQARIDRLLRAKTPEALIMTGAPDVDPALRNALISKYPENQAVMRLAAKHGKPAGGA